MPVEIVLIQWWYPAYLYQKKSQEIIGNYDLNLHCKHTLICTGAKLDKKAWVHINIYIISGQGRKSRDNICIHLGWGRKILGACAPPKLAALVIWLSIKLLSLKGVALWQLYSASITIFITFFEFPIAKSYRWQMLL